MLEIMKDKSHETSKYNKIVPLEENEHIVSANVTTGTSTKTKRPFTTSVQFMICTIPSIQLIELDEYLEKNKTQVQVPFLFPQIYEEFKDNNKINSDEKDN
jgi:hypothetical protein